MRGVALPICLLLLLLSCYPSQKDAGQTADFRLPTPDGQVLGPPDFRGQNVVVVFWASWCGPCRIQERILADFYRQQRHRGTEILAANQGESEETVRRFLSRHPVPFPVLLDPEQELGQRYQILALPTLFIVDRHGEIVFSRRGIVTASELERALPRS